MFIIIFSLLNNFFIIWSLYILYILLFPNSTLANSILLQRLCPSRSWTTLNVQLIPKLVEDIYTYNIRHINNELHINSKHCNILIDIQTNFNKVLNLLLWNKCNLQHSPL